MSSDMSMNCEKFAKFTLFTVGIVVIVFENHYKFI